MIKVDYLIMPEIMTDDMHNFLKMHDNTDLIEPNIVNVGDINYNNALILSMHA